MNEQVPVLQVEGLTKHFPVSGRKVVHAVDDVSFSVLRGKTLGLVGESGCGKSSCARTIIRIYEPTAGKILIDGEDISDLNQKQLLPIRKKMQMIFQDPYASLNARMTVHDIIAEPLRAHQICTSRQEENERISDMLARVGLNRDHANRYAHEFSGGQRQRVGIARALILKPELVICDEPISALDVSIQAQVVNMLRHFQEELGLTYLSLHMICLWCGMFRMMSGLCISVSLWKNARQMRFTPTPCIPIRQDCFLPFPFRIQGWQKQRRKAAWKEIFRARSIRRPDAASIRAVLMLQSVAKKKLLS